MRVAECVNNVWKFSIYDIGGKMIAEYGGRQATDEGGVKYVLQDWQGSTRAIVNNSGFVNARIDYTAFGEEISSGVGLRTAAQGFGSSNTLNQKYALTERDEATGLDHTWFRKNENQAGRWTSPDPYGGSMDVGDPQSFNRYAYVSNDPVNFTDASGLNEEGPIIHVDTWTWGWFDWMWDRHWGPENGGDGFDSGRRGPPIIDDAGGGGGREPSPQGDPCAGKKGKLNFNDRYNKKWGMKDHIFPRHIEQTKYWERTGKSVYGFGPAVHSAQAFGFGAKQAVVEFLDQITFDRGTVADVRRDRNGSIIRIAYSYELPGINTPAGAISMFVGKDNTGENAPRGSYTNVNTVVVYKDCETVITSHPGYPSGATPSAWAIWENRGFPYYFTMGW